jgi:hypothetical protein
MSKHLISEAVAVADSLRAIRSQLQFLTRCNPHSPFADERAVSIILTHAGSVAAALDEIALLLSVEEN